MINSSDIALICYISNIIEYSRNNIQLDFNEVILILTFLGDNIQLGKSKIWINKEEFLNILTSLYITNNSPFYFTLNRKLIFNSIDELINLMDLIPDLLIIPNSIDPNNVLLPFMFKRDSLVGIYLRTILAKWNLFQFGEISQCYEEYLKFCSNETNNSSISTKNSITNNSIVLSTQSIKYQKPSDYLINAENAINNHDLLPAIESIHSYFDYSGNDPLHTKGDIISQTRTIIDNYLSCSQQQKFRYQQAMLTLANMWIRNGYYFYANTATEEGMKMAHQLGDHTSVTYALLLLHHIIQGQEKLELENLENENENENHDYNQQRNMKSLQSNNNQNNQNNNNSNSNNNSNNNEDINQITENILIRCIQKSYELKLKSLEIQAIQLFIRHRMKGSLKNCVESNLGYTPLSITLNPLFSSNLKYKCDLTPYMIWALLQSTYSDKQSLLFLTSNQSKSNKSNNNIQGIQQSQQTQQSSDNNIVTTSGIFSSKIKLLNESFLIMSDVWNDLNIPSMSLLTCFRAIKQCGVFLTMNDFVIQLLKYCEINLELHENDIYSIIYNFILLQKYSTKNICNKGKLKLIVDINIEKLKKGIQNFKLLENILNNFKKVEQIYDNVIQKTKLNIDYLSYLIKINQNFLYYLIELLSYYSMNDERLMENFINNSDNEYLNTAINDCEILMNCILSNFKSFHIKEFYLCKIYYNFIHSFINIKISLSNLKKLEYILSKNSLTKLSNKLKIIKVLILVINKVIINRNNRNNNYKLNDLLIDVQEMKEMCKMEYRPDMMAVLSHIPQEIFNEWIDK